ncbi:MAG: hypothetical protein JXA15_07865 [Spirochaetales bacterium]|nr:hypothetical protein [Spirochaetales bacterium]
MSIRKLLPISLLVALLALVVSCKTAPASEGEVAPDVETAASEPWEG